MTTHARDGLVALRRLTASDRSEIEALAALCREHEPGLDLPLYYGECGPALPAARDINHFAAYQGGALVGLAELTPGDEVEVQCMVHPAHRRRGIGRALVGAVQRECVLRGASRCTLVCEAAAPSGPSFAQAMGAAYHFAEHRMELDHAAYAHQPRRRRTLTVTPAGVRDLDAVAAIRPIAPDVTPALHREAMLRWLQQENRQYYLGRLGEQAICMLRVGIYPPQAFVESFRVLPAHRGQGYGRQILTDVIDRLIAAGWEHIMLEVETDNDTALSLYRSCGFREVATYLYYRLPCAPHLAADPDRTEQTGRLVEARPGGDTGLGESGARDICASTAG